MSMDQDLDRYFYAINRMQVYWFKRQGWVRLDTGLIPSPYSVACVRLFDRFVRQYT